jgi:hypothetical protein
LCSHQSLVTYFKLLPADALNGGVKFLIHGFTSMNELKKHQTSQVEENNEHDLLS